MEKASLATQEDSRLIGAPVKNLQEEELGVIKDLVPDSIGKITFAILFLGGVSGVGEKEVAVPFKALTYREDTRDFTLNVNKERLAIAPEFKRGTDLNDHIAGNEIYRFYGIAPPWGEEETKEGDMEGVKPTDPLTR
jgi:hypothetical protein